MKVLLAEDEKSIAITLGDALRDAGHDVVVVSDGESAINQLRGQGFDVLISDIRMPKADGLSVLQQAKSIQPEIEAILITAYGTDETAFRAAKQGAFGYIRKPFFNEDVLAELEKVGRQVELRREVRRLRAQGAGVGPQGPIVGRSPQMTKLFDLVARLARSDAAVLIEGENGTGKDLLARQIHALSARKEAPFEVFTPSTTADTLLEGHLFGWVKGAFTGAVRDQAGLFERADGGTVFMDDVDDVPLGTQAKFLRVLQNKEVERLGDGKRIHVDIRIITATKKNLPDLVKAGAFREDLYFRLNVATLRVPPLRERIEDIPLLVEHFIQKHGKGVEYHVPEAAMEALKAYHWPGNVRELEHAVERAIAYADPDHAELRHDYLLQAAAGGSRSLEEIVAEAELKAIRSAVAQTGGHKGEAAKLLGITRKLLWLKMKEHGLE